MHFIGNVNHIFQSNSSSFVRGVVESQVCRSSEASLFFCMVNAVYTMQNKLSDRSRFGLWLCTYAHQSSVWIDYYYIVNHQAEILGCSFWDVHCALWGRAVRNLTYFTEGFAIVTHLQHLVDFLNRGTPLPTYSAIHDGQCLHDLWLTELILNPSLAIGSTWSWCQ